VYSSSLKNNSGDEVAYLMSELNKI